MSAHQAWKTASLMLCVAAATTTAPLLAQNESAPAKDGSPAVIEVKPAKLKGIVRQRGWLERSRIAEITCPVEGQSTIRSLVPHGTAVKADDIVCELERSALEDALLNQEIATKSAEAACEEAGLQREVAKLALVEYTEGTAKHEESNLQLAINASDEAVRAAQERLGRTELAHKRVHEAAEALGGTKSPADILAELDIDDRLTVAKLRLQNEKLRLEQNQVKKHMFLKFLRGKATKELKANIERATAEELLKQQSWVLQQTREKKYRSEIAKCTIRASMDGVVALRSRAIGADAIAVGSTIRRGETLLTISSGPLVAKVALPEVFKSRIAAGNSVHITPIAGRGTAFVLSGVVDQISALEKGRRPARMGTEQACLVTIKIDQRPLLIEPDQDLRVDIAANEVDNALVVPPEAVLRRNGVDYVAVASPESGIDWRQITVGATSDTSVEIVQGVKAGESVVSRASTLLRREGVEVDFR